MGSSLEFVRYVMDQLDLLESVSAKKMFGEYGVFMNGKMVALICDDQFFVKPTPEGEALILQSGVPVMAPPYPGAKPYFLIEDQLEEPQWLARLIDLTESVLPAPKPKTKKKAL